VFHAADREVILAVGNDRQFASFCRVAGHPDLAEDPRFKTNPQRVRHRELLVPLLEPILRGRGSGEWMTALAEADVPCGLVNAIDEVFAHPQVVHRGLRIDLPHALGVPSPTIANPMRFSATPVGYDRPPPMLGQHTREVLTRVLGMRPADIDTLTAEGVI
jgi:crotonobetainyl-CoA:carnitine CoA-transferase CaiB-like acyl-CoA transferase